MVVGESFPTNKIKENIIKKLLNYRRFYI